MGEDKKVYRMVIDVESIGLHGEAFAVGFVVVDRDGRRVDQALIACQPKLVPGLLDDHAWVRGNVNLDVPEGLPAFKACESAREVRSIFWNKWLQWREEGVELWADCGWPVEARFLAACVDDEYASRAWAGPYPLQEIATLATMRGYEPTRTWDRYPDEMPAHNPLMDARQSARVLIGLLQEMGR